MGIRDIRGLVEGVLGEDRLPWITDRILKTLEANRDGRIRWAELKEGLGKVMESARRDVAGAEKKVPQWIASSRKARRRGARRTPRTMAHAETMGVRAMRCNERARRH